MLNTIWYAIKVLGSFAILLSLIGIILMIAEAIVVGIISQIKHK